MYIKNIATFKECIENEAKQVQLRFKISKHIIDENVWRNGSTSSTIHYTHFVAINPEILDWVAEYDKLKILFSFLVKSYSRFFKATFLRESSKITLNWSTSFSFLEIKRVILWGQETRV